MPGDLMMFVERISATCPAPNALSQPMVHGEWTIVTSYEASVDDQTSPPRLRYGFASLDDDGRTVVVNTAQFLQMHMKTDDIEEIVARWEQEMTQLTEKVNKNRPGTMRMLAEHRSTHGLESPSGIAGLETTLLAVNEVDEIFRALDNMGRLASPPR